MSTGSAKEDELDLAQLSRARKLARWFRALSVPAGLAVAVVCVFLAAVALGIVVGGFNYFRCKGDVSVTVLHTAKCKFKLFGSAKPTTTSGFTFTTP